MTLVATAHARAFIRSFRPFSMHAKLSRARWKTPVRPAPRPVEQSSVRMAVYSIQGVGGDGLEQAVQLLEDSFSAVSKPIFASKYALNFCRIFQARKYLRAFAPLQIQILNRQSIAKSILQICQILKGSPFSPTFIAKMQVRLAEYLFAAAPPDRRLRRAPR